MAAMEEQLDRPILAYSVEKPLDMPYALLL
jgi:hypothetical protein